MRIIGENKGEGNKLWYRQTGRQTEKKRENRERKKKVRKQRGSERERERGSEREKERDGERRRSLISAQSHSLTKRWKLVKCQQEGKNYFFVKKKSNTVKNRNFSDFHINAVF